jgi:hypothetical protein
VEAEGGKGEVDPILFWEKQLQLQLRIPLEEEYIKIPRIERARFIIAMKLSDWFSTLDWEEWKREHPQS